MRPCAEPGCPTLTTNRRCPTHTRTTNQARGTRQTRGYDNTHDRERARWAPLVNAGQAHCTETTCLEPTRHINPNSPWDLAHTPDRTHYLGPAHARCNRAAGGRASHT